MNTSRYSGIFILLFIFVIIISGCNKTSRLDEEYLSGEDLRTDSLLNFYDSRVFVNPDSVRQMIINDKRTMQDSVNYYFLHRFLFFYYEMKAYPDSGSYVCRDVLRFCQKPDRKKTPRLAKLEAAACIAIGDYISRLGLYDSSNVYINQAIDALYRPEAAVHKNKLPDYYLMLSNNYSFSGKYPEAIRACNQSLLLADSLHLVVNVKIRTYVKLARNYLSLKNYKLADYFFELIEQNEDKLDIYEQYNNAGARGEYYLDTKAYDKAILYYRKGYDYAKESGVDYFLSPIFGNLGECYLQLNQLDSAQFYLDKASGYYTKYKDFSDPSIIHYVNLLYADLYTRKNELSKAERILSEYADVSIPSSHTAYLAERNLEELYSKKGDFKKAYEHRLKADIYNDSIRGIMAQNLLAEVESRYMQDTTLMKRDILISQKEQKVQEFRNMSLVLVLILVIIVLGVFAVVIYIRRKNELRHSRQMSAMTKLRMENVRNRVSPHFILNVLNSIVPGMREHESLNHSVQLLIQSIRNSLLISEESAITLGEEINIVKDYVELRKNINPHLPGLQWNIAPDVNLNVLLPSMMLQIPVENSLKYAFDPASLDKQIVIDITQKNDLVSIVIEDNGMGFDPSRQPENNQGTGTGLKILYRTVALLNEKNHRKIKFSIQNKADTEPDGHGTKVLIGIPVGFRYDN